MIGDIMATGPSNNSGVPFPRGRRGSCSPLLALVWVCGAVDDGGSGTFCGIVPGLTNPYINKQSSNLQHAEFAPFNIGSSEQLHTQGTCRQRREFCFLNLRSDVTFKGTAKFENVSRSHTIMAFGLIPRFSYLSEDQSRETIFLSINFHSPELVENLRRV